MTEQEARRIVEAFEAAFEKLGLTLHGGFRHLCEVVDRNLAVWKQFTSRERMIAILIKEKDPAIASPATLRWVEEEFPGLLRREGIKQLKQIPPLPGGRPVKIPVDQHEEVRRAVDELLEAGVARKQAFAQIAQKWNKASPKTIQRIWEDRHSRKA